ncbi:hypothetical protein VZT92_003715 [Zoarces viviparus]|uniref:Uncharacterized protein n=1 Tax=Zoarces viviparus TaxID=48416 RepID=A0AAW1FW57_ZOAVI
MISIGDPVHAPAGTPLRVLRAALHSQLLQSRGPVRPFLLALFASSPAVAPTGPRGVRRRRRGNEPGESAPKARQKKS